MQKKVTLGFRILLGLIFFVFGLNGFFMFIPLPPLSESAGNLMMAMIQSGYLMKVVKVLEVLGGVLLLTGFFVPFALAILGPIVVNIFLFHAFLDPNGIPMSVFLLLAFLWLVVAYRDEYPGLFRMKAEAEV